MIKKHQTIPNWRLFYKVTDYFLQKCQDQETQRKARGLSKFKENKEPWPLNATKCNAWS